jgi:hypothetical protein
LNGLSVTPVFGSDVGEAIGLENLLRLDTTFDKEVNKESSDVSGLGAREVLGRKKSLCSQRGVAGLGIAGGS